jgi:hypothetical protein
VTDLLVGGSSLNAVKTEAHYHGERSMGDREFLGLISAGESLAQGLDFDIIAESAAKAQS